MDVSVSSVQGVPHLTLSGEIDHSNAHSLQQALDRELASRPGFLLLDVREVEYIDSGGISVLARLLRTFKNRGWVGLIAPSPSVLRLLEIVALTCHEHMRVFKDVLEAEGALEAAQHHLWPWWPAGQTTDEPDVGLQEGA
jgi:stage II sporulation protein AA (anti-sigma F factor antagonist)